MRRIPRSRRADSTPPEMTGSDKISQLISSAEIMAALGREDVAKAILQEVEDLKKGRKAMHRNAGDYMGAFMQPVVEKGEWWSVEGNAGTELIPADELSLTPDDLEEIQQLLDASYGSYSVRRLGMGLERFIESTEIYGLELVRGYSAYISAPGYMDRTDDAVFDTEEEAISYLLEEYPEAFNVVEIVQDFAVEHGLEMGFEPEDIEDELPPFLFRLVALGSEADYAEPLLAWLNR